MMQNKKPMLLTTYFLNKNKNNINMFFNLLRIEN